MPLQLQCILSMQRGATVLNAAEQGKRSKTQKRLSRFMKSEKEKTVSIVHLTFKSACERKERNRIVARRGNTFKLNVVFKEGTMYIRNKRKEV